MYTTQSVPDPEVRPTLTVPEAAKILGICREGAYRAARNGSLPTVKVGRAVRVPTAALRRMLMLEESNPATSTTAGGDVA